MHVKDANKLYWYNGKSLTLKDWAKVKRTKWPVLHRRIVCNHWSFKKAMEEPING